jgi:hypothetical protein
MSEPTIEELRARLEKREEALAMCDFIDDYGAYHRCRESNHDAIYKLKDEIARRETATPSRLWPPSGNAEAHDVSD